MLVLILADDLAALLNLTNAMLPTEAPALVREGEFTLCQVLKACAVFDDLADQLNDYHGNDEWLQEGTP